VAAVERGAHLSGRQLATRELPVMLPL